MNTVHFSDCIKNFNNQISDIEKALTLQEKGAELSHGFAVYAARYYDIAQCIEKSGKSQKNILDIGCEELKMRVSLLSKRMEQSCKASLPSELQSALQRDDVATLRNILKCKQTLDFPLPNGTFPLYYAVRLGSYETVKWILENLTVDSSAQDFQGLTLLDHAYLSDNSKIFSLCLEKLCISHNISEKKIEDSLKIPEKTLAKAIDSIKPVLASAPPVEEELHSAAYIGDRKAFESIPEGSNKLNASLTVSSLIREFPKEEGKLTPLHVAIIGKEPHIAYLLLEKGSNPWLLTDSGKNALHLAALVGDHNLVEKILDLPGCKADLLDKDGKSALHYAVRSGNWKTVSLLVERGGGDLFSKIEDVSLFDLLVFQIRKKAAEKDPIQLYSAVTKRLGARVAAIALNQGYWWVSGGQKIPFHLRKLGQWLYFSSPYIYREKTRTCFEVACLSYTTGSFDRYLSYPSWHSKWNTIWSIHSVFNAYQGIENCWKNRHYEIKRPLLFSALHLLDLGSCILDFVPSNYFPGGGAESEENLRCEVLDKRHLDGARAIEECFKGELPLNCMDKQNKEDILKCCLQTKAKSVQNAWNDLNPFGCPEHADLVLGLDPGENLKAIEEKAKTLSSAFDSNQKLKKIVADSFPYISRFAAHEKGAIAVRQCLEGQEAEECSLEKNKRDRAVCCLRTRTQHLEDYWQDLVLSGEENSLWKLVDPSKYQARSRWVLGLSPKDELKDLKKRFQAMSLGFHPDKNPNMKSNQLPQLITEAYSVLSQRSSKKTIEPASTEPFEDIFLPQKKEDKSRRLG